MKEINNESLGNFGFLLEFNQGFLFELAQFAESNLYLNKRMCAVFIRELTEGFFDVVLEMEKIAISSKKESDKSYEVSSIQYKQTKIIKYYNDYNANRPQFGKIAFPKWPGKLNDKRSRVSCPEGEGTNRRYKEGPLVDEEKKTIYVWDFIRKIGNAGSHAVLSDTNMKWLDEKYLIVALEQLCNRMRMFFYGYNNRENRENYDVEKQSMASREVYFPVSSSLTSKIIYDGVLPNYDEKEYYTVMPKVKKQFGKNKWENLINRYTIIRKYEMKNYEEVKHYLLHSQRAYLILQQNAKMDGIARYSVLADLRNCEDYYVTAYEFDSKPKEMNIYTLEDYDFFRNKSLFLNVIYQFLNVMSNLSELHVYHRGLTHNSIKLLKQENGTVKLQIIDFELVKLFEQQVYDENETVCIGFNEQIQKYNELKSNVRSECKMNIGQYGNKVWDSESSEEEYNVEQRKRTGMIICNMLCPIHFDNNEDFDDYASEEEVFDEYNMNRFEFDHKYIKDIYGVASNLIKKNISIKEAVKDLERMMD